MLANSYYPPAKANRWKTPGGLQSNTPAYQTQGFSTGAVNLGIGASTGWQHKKKNVYKEKSQEILCKICNILCSSKSTYEDHIKGKKHLKREKDSRTYSCEICNVYCVTAKEQKDHFNTELHAESVKVQEYLGSQSNDKKKPIQTGPVKPDTGAISAAELEEIKKFSIDDSGKWWLCELCAVKTNSEEMHKKHLDSKKHRARAQDVELNKKNVIKEFSCGICEYICYSAEDRDAHVASDAHIRKVILSETSNTTTLSKLAADTEEPAVVPIRAADNTIWYPCEVCDVKMNSLENYRTHVNSKRHKAKVSGVSIVSPQARKQKYSSEFLRENYNRFVQSQVGLSSKITGNPSAFCAKCEIQFETPTELENHFMTQEHKMFQPIKRKYCFNQETDSDTKKAKTTPANSKPETTAITSQAPKTQASTTASQPSLENYGYANPSMHVVTAPDTKYTYNQANTYASSGPSSNAYAGQKQYSSYGYAHNSSYKQTQSYNYNPTYKQQPSYGYNSTPATAVTNTYPSYGGGAYKSYGSSYKAAPTYQGYNTSSYNAYGTGHGAGPYLI